MQITIHSTILIVLRKMQIMLEFVEIKWHRYINFVEL